MVAGGWPASGSTPLTTTEIYDVATGMFAPGPDMITPRFPDTATFTLLADGRVFVYGGTFQYGRAGPEMYDPTTNTFQSHQLISDFSTLYQSATRLADGRILLGSGIMYGKYEYDNEDQMNAIYDPVSDTLHQYLNLPGGVALHHTATLLADDTVLLAGGYHSFRPIRQPLPIFLTRRMVIQPAARYIHS